MTKPEHKQIIHLANFEVNEKEGILGWGVGRILMMDHKIHTQTNIIATSENRYKHSVNTVCVYVLLTLSCGTIPQQSPTNSLKAAPAEEAAARLLELSHGAVPLPSNSRAQNSSIFLPQE